MSQLNRIERACLAYLRRTGIAPDPHQSSYRDGLLALRDSTGRVLVEIAADGLEVTASDLPIVRLARVSQVVIVLRCWSCDRRWLCGSQYVPHEVSECPRCGVGNIAPADPLAAARG